MTETHLVGRDRELDALRGFFDDVGDGEAGVVIEGERGIGKSALWACAVGEARRRGFTVLRSSPAPQESQLSYSGLADLLLERLDELAETLPAPQARALEVALMVQDPAQGEGPPDELAVSLAVLGALRSLAEADPVIVAVDDLDFLDASTARALAFALRRSTDRSVGLLAVSSGDELAVEEVLPRDRVRRVSLGPLGPDDLDRILRERFGTSLLRPHLTQLAGEARGNPLLALEIAGSLIRSGTTPEPGAPLPVPSSLAELARERVSSLSNEARSALLLAAATSDPSVEVLDAVGAGEGIRKAAAEGVVEIDEGTVRFTNPVAGSVVYEDAAEDERRDAHRRLATVVPTKEEQAHHLARATNAPAEATAATLEEAAVAVRLRGAPYAAAELATAAERLTPESDAESRHRRGLAAAEYLLDAGDVDRARLLLEELVDQAPSAEARASAMQRLGWIRLRRESWSGAEQLIDMALQEAAHEPDVRASLELDAAMGRMLAGDLSAAAEHAQQAMALSRELDRDDLLGEALAVSGSLDFLMGEGVPQETMEQAETLESWDRARPTPVHPSVAYGLLLKWSDDLDGARKRLTRALQHATESGNERSLPFLLYHLAELACWAGDWALAQEHATRADRIAVQTGQTSSRAFTLFARALVDALQGDVDSARACSGEGLELAERSGAAPVAVLHAANLGFVELSTGDAARAHRYLGPLADAVLETGIYEPGVTRYVGDAVEALVGVGDLERAVRVLEVFEEAAERVGRASSQAASARGRALLAAATGDLAKASDAAERSVEIAEPLGQPFELARSLLVLGAIRRRDRRKKDARDALERARELLQQLGAERWVERADEELARIGGRAPAPLELTPTEERVAAAVAEGKTNQEVAQTLFMSVKTVEWNLSRIYRKLGIRSRTELTRWIGDRGSPTI